MRDLNSKKQNISSEHERIIYEKDFEHTAKIVEAEERTFSLLTNLLLGLLSLLIAHIIPNAQKIDKVIKEQSDFIIVLFIFSLFIITYTVIINFSDRSKAILTAKRKIVILRNRFGVSYSNYHKILPENGYEGGSHPFLIKVSPPLLAPMVLIIFIVALIIYYYSCYLFYTSKTLNFFPHHLSKIFPLLYLLFIFYYICKNFDTHENFGFWISSRIAWMLRYKIDQNISHTLYSAELAISELNRFEIDTKNIIDMLIHIEDKRFRSHLGISLKGIGRMICSLLPCLNKKSGGSTITQQLTRTLFFQESFRTKRIRRKILEIICALIWVDRTISKDDQLDLYLVSVQYDRGVLGIQAALHHFFFGENITRINKAQAFFLAERIANINSKFLENRISILIENLKQAGILSIEDIYEIKCIYISQVNNGKIESNKDVITNTFDKFL